MSQVNIKVSSELRAIIEDLDRITAASKKLENELGKIGKDTEDQLEKSTGRIERFLNETRSLGARVAKQLTGDFKALLSLNAVQGALKLSNQFSGTIKESVTLSDTIRKLGQTFGIASNNFASFQGKITKGLGEIGLSSEVATQSLGALADTPVRGEENLIGYSKTAGQLASIGNEQGQAGNIAGGIANVIQARGGNPNDLREVGRVAEDLRRVFNQTGKGPAETLATMQELFRTMAPDFRKTISTRGLANLTAAGQVAGPGSTKFIEEMLGRSPIARKALEAQGFGKVFTDQGLDVEKFGKASKSILSRIGFDPTQAAKTLGISDEAAQGFVRLAESLDRVKAAQAGISKQTGNLNDQYRQNMGLGEAFRANLNKLKGYLGGPLGKITQGATDLLGKSSQTSLGAGLVVGGGGLLAALLAGGGLRGIGGALFGTAAKAGIAKELTGKEVQPVYVVNASEIGGGGLCSALAAGGGASMLSKVPLLGGALLAGATAGVALDKAGLNPLSYKPVDDKMSKLVDALYQWMHPTNTAKPPSQTHKVQVELNKRELKERAPLTKGASY